MGRIKSFSEINKHFALAWAYLSVLRPHRLYVALESVSCRHYIFQYLRVALGILASRDCFPILAVPYNNPQIIYRQLRFEIADQTFV